MTSTSTPVRAQPWTTRALVSRHKRLALASAGLLAILVVMLAAALLTSNVGAVSDRTVCSAWSSANQSQQQAYAVLYVREHGAVPGGGTSAASVEAAIDRGCLQAFGSDAADLVTVEQAINRQY